MLSYLSEFQLDLSILEWARDPLMDAKKINEYVTTCLDIARPYNATAMMLSFAVGYVYLWPDNWWNLIVGLVLILLLHSAVTLRNDIADLEIDKSNERSSVLISGQLSPKHAQQIYIDIVIVALIVAMISTNQLTALLFCLSIVIAGWAYNDKPFQFSMQPVSSIVDMALFYGAIPLVFGLALAGHKLTLGFILFTVFFAAQRFSISILKDFKDAKGDKRHHKQTFLLKYGAQKVAVISNVLGWASYAAMILIVSLKMSFGIVHVIGVVLLIILAIMNGLLRKKLLQTTDNNQLKKIFPKVFLAENQFNLLLIVCLLLQ